MVAATGFESLDALVDATVPKAIRRPDLLDLGAYTEGMRESEFLTKFKCAPACPRCRICVLGWRGQAPWSRARVIALPAPERGALFL